MKRDDEDNWGFAQRMYCDRKCYWENKKGKKLSKEHIEKIRKANKGRIMSQESIEKGREKIRKSVKKLWQNPEYRKRQIKAHKGKFIGKNHPGWKGGKNKCLDCGKELSGRTVKRCKKCFGKSEEFRNKISKAHKGKKLSEEHKRNIGKAHKGGKHWAWKGGITSDIQKIRDSVEYRNWRLKVYAQNNYTCQKCNQKGGIILHAHHIYNFSNNESLRFEVFNGITFCNKCHMKFHSKYGKRKNTLNQVLEFLQ